MIGIYDLELEKLKKIILERNAKRVLLQFPEGMKKESLEVMRELSSVCEPVLSVDPCFGACDIRTIPEADLTVHFCHTRMVEDERVVYVPCFSDADLIPVVKKALPLLPKTVSLATTVQHAHRIEEVREFLESEGFKVLLSKGNGMEYPGQVLGCNFSAVQGHESQAILFIGSGRFHPLGAAYYTRKRVIAADPSSMLVQEILPDQAQKEKYARISKAYDARVFGVVVSTKPGQKRFSVAQELAEQMRGRGAQAFVLVGDMITPDVLDYLPFDAFVITACPRIVIDDWKNYKKPVLLPEEAVELLKITQG